MDNYEMDFSQFSFPDVTEFTYGTSKKALQKAFDSAEYNRKTRTNHIFECLMVASPAFAALLEGLKTNEVVRIIISDEARANLMSGKWSWINAKDQAGFFRAIIKDENGKMVEQALLGNENIAQGVNIGQMAVAMQGMAIQKELMDISEKLDLLLVKADEILAGQHNDRLGLYYAAEFLYQEALKVNNVTLREQMIAESLSLLSSAIEQIKQTTIYELSKVASMYNPDRQSFRRSVDENTVSSIKSSFQVIHKAVGLKTAIYCCNGEYTAATCSLLEYREFLMKSLEGHNGEAIYYADRKEKSLAGFWNIRKNEIPLKIENICRNLKNYDNYYIEYKNGGAV